MPSLTMFKRPGQRETSRGLTKWLNGSGRVDDTTTDEEGSTIAGDDRQRRGSKRDILQDLINRSLRLAGGRSFSAPQERAIEGRGPPQRKTAQSYPSTPSSESPLSPRSIVNANKPLPSPPPPDSEEVVVPIKAKPVLKLARIMATLSDKDIEKLFSGAPQYFARAEGHFTGAPHPSVAYPWDECLEIRDLTDHVQIEDEAWSCATAWPHITRESSRAGLRDSAKSLNTRKRSHFHPRCRERPNMLSMTGLEKGTIGYQAALEMAVADALQEEQFGFDSLGSKAKVIIEARQKLLTAKDGLRRVDETKVLDELIKNGSRYLRNDVKEDPSSTKLYNELFNQLLHPPTRVLDHSDPYSLSVQIHALLTVLATPNVWVDFSRVEWRIRLGQILWTSSIEDDVEDGASIQDIASADERYEERYWLLLQILLACELLVRLDAITEGEELGAESIRPSEVHRFEKEANTSVKWSLILARKWLENIEVTKTEAPVPGTPVEQPSGWLAALTKRMSLSHESNSQPPRIHEPVYAMKGKFGERQVQGLAHFATSLRWPDIESQASRIAHNARSVTSGAPLNTPLATPMITGDTQRSSYFDGLKSSHELKRQPSRRRKIAAALNPSGWLSKSYISGLMLPGEGISHFLMSTLLENDKEAMARLGSMANLCGGFVYSGKSFWSTACIVGRVLAAGKGSSECMGWISSDITPKDLGEGWVNIEVEELREDALLINRRARLWGKTTIEKESSVLGDADPSSVLPADFIIPSENIYNEKPPSSIAVELKSLDLFAPTDSVRTTPTGEFPPTPYTGASRQTEIQTYPAAITFALSTEKDDQPKEYTYSLSNDVNFVTAHPCLPSQHVRILKSPSSPTIQQIDVSGTDLSAGSSTVVQVTGHPLHKYYTYTAIHLSELIKKQEASLDEHLTDYASTSHRPSQSTHAATHKMPKVLVIDCITSFAPRSEPSLTPASPRDTPHVSSVTVLSSSEPPPTVVEKANASAGADATKGNETESQEKEAKARLHKETRRRQLGSDMEVLVRAFCAERGWNAIISRRRRGCLACAIREAGALGWKVVIRVD